MNVLRIAAFCDGTIGGNPAGVAISDALPDETQMQLLAREVGFSETVFAAPMGSAWRVRYFSPQCEVPFCGHATIALGAALALTDGPRVFALTLNHTQITVEGRRDGSVALQSPPTRSAPVEPALATEALRMFGYRNEDLDTRIPPALCHGGADHLVLALETREALAAMKYDLSVGRELMDRERLLTIMLVHSQNDQLFHARNAFASGGVYEDPATGAAAAAFAGYLRDLGWPHAGAIDIVQGEDMGMRSRVRAEISEASGASIRVSGAVRFL